MRFYGGINKYQVLLIPCIGIINEPLHYGYPVISISFGWLWFYCYVEIDIRRYRRCNDGK